MGLELLPSSAGATPGRAHRLIGWERPPCVHRRRNPEHRRDQADSRLLRQAPPLTRSLFDADEHTDTGRDKTPKELSYPVPTFPGHPPSFADTVAGPGQTRFRTLPPRADAPSDGKSGDEEISESFDGARYGRGSCHYVPRRASPLGCSPGGSHVQERYLGCQRHDRDWSRSRNSKLSLDEAVRLANGSLALSRFSPTRAAARFTARPGHGRQA